MVCKGDAVKAADGSACVLPLTAGVSCNDKAPDPAEIVFEGPLGDVVIRDDGDGIFGENDEIDIAPESYCESVQAQQQSETKDEVKKRFEEMGVKAIPGFGTPLKPFKAYVTHIQEARRLAVDSREVTEDEVVDKLILADEAAISASIPVDDELQSEILKSWEESRKYYDLISFGKLTKLPFFDENGKYVEENIDEAAKVAGDARIPSEQVKTDALGVRFVLSNTRFAEGLAYAREGNKIEALKSLEEARSIADIGGFEEAIKAMIEEEYLALISVDSLSTLPFFDEGNRNDVEGQLGVASILAQAIEIPAKRIERDAQNARYELCIHHYVEASMYSREGKIEEARASLEKADSISDMGDFQELFGMARSNILKAIGDLEKANESRRLAGERGGGVWRGLLGRIGEFLTHPVGKGVARFAWTPGLVESRKGK